ncbi:gamma-aminobutyrate transaminase POP2 [Cucumis melo var. makuwa]|uniref:Gamma-aminobutyrate transaminase POP2 n=1 Tax=Cucumis melo var. makuwa TaxID=1194695 RepID=A0A5D3BKL5_CUCMM|nr:gamma-aminobutyrate transaminase POP2 [Cucumis melo var. makuwa]
MVSSTGYRTALSENLSHDFFLLTMGPSFDVRCYNGCIMNICHMQAEQATANDSDEPLTMSSFSSSFDEIDVMFFEFVEELDNPTGGSLSVGDNSGTYQPSTTLTRFFVLDFNDQAINRFVEHQMINTFKEFQGGCHMHFKKYRDPDEAHNQILELHSQLAPDGTQPLFGNEICGMVFGRRSCYLKGLDWGLKPKARKTASASSSTTSCSQSTVELQLRAALYQAMKCIEKCLKNHDVLASEVERMRKLIEDTSPAQQGPPHDP